MHPGQQAMAERLFVEVAHLARDVHRFVGERRGFDRAGRARASTSPRRRPSSPTSSFSLPRLRARIRAQRQSLLRRASSSPRSKARSPRNSRTSPSTRTSPWALAPSPSPPRAFRSAAAHCRRRMARLAAGDIGVGQPAPISDAGVRGEARSMHSSARAHCPSFRCTTPRLMQSAPIWASSARSRSGGAPSPSPGSPPSTRRRACG